MKIYDISPTVSARTAVFPGDVPFAREVALDYAKGDHLVLSSIRTTVHIGAHADAPSHYHPEGVTIEARDPGRYLGPCQVIRVRVEPGVRVTIDDLGEKAIEAPRVLIATGSFPDPDTWNDDFNSLSRSSNTSRTEGWCWWASIRLR